MPKRFNNLDAALKYLKSTSDTTTENPEAPVGSQLRLYQDFKAGKRTVTYTRSAASKPGADDEVTVKPFAFASADTTEYLTAISSRAKAGFANAGVTLASLGLSETLTNGVKVSGFIPAKAIITYTPGTTTALTDSKLTGKKYIKNTTRVTYSYAFGRTATEVTFSAQKAAITAAVLGATERGISFKPERF